MLSSGDSGQTWTAQTSGTTSSVNTLSCPSVAICYAWATGSLLLKTNNAGATWQKQPIDNFNEISSLACSTNTECKAVGESGTILSSRDSGLTWQNERSGSFRILLDIDCESNGRCITTGNVGTILSNEVLLVPTNLTARAVSQTVISLSWQDRAGGESGFRLERKIGLTGDWTFLANLPANTVSYQDLSLTTGTIYRYRIQAYNPTSFSGYSIEAGAVTQASLIVTEPQDDGTGNVGTLSSALMQAQTVSDKTIIFRLPNGISTINLTGQLPSVPVGTLLGGNCEAGKPAIVINTLGSLVLQGGTLLYGLQINGKVIAQAGGNRSGCLIVRITNALTILNLQNPY